MQEGSAMGRTFVAFLLAATVMTASGARAATTAGTVTAVDSAKHTVTLDDGKVYTTSPTTDLTRIQLGYTVQLTFTASGSTNNVSTMEILSPRQSSGY
jgi:hypothetical protein